jgi:hypothetical protein
LLTNYTREQLDKAIQTQKTQLQPDLPGQQWEAQEEQIWYPRVGGPLLLPLRSWWEERSWKPARIPKRKDTFQS